ncbi:MAG: transcription termination/antitermination NusG family protein, partial [Cypionkella sp.]
MPCGRPPRRHRRGYRSPRAPIIKDANWYVLRVKIGCEKKIGLNLHNLGFEVLYPLKRELRDWSDRKKWV